MQLNLPFESPTNFSVKTFEEMYRIYSVYRVLKKLGHFTPSYYPKDLREKALETRFKRIEQIEYNWPGLKDLIERCYNENRQ